MSHETFELALANGENLAIRVLRHAQARRIKLALDERGARLTLPPGMDIAAGQAFVMQHRDWLQQQLSQHAPAPALVVGQSRHLPLRGEALPLHWQAARATGLHLEDTGVVFAVRNPIPGQPLDAAMRRALRDFYLAHARADIARFLPRHRAGLGRDPARIVLKQMSSRWGSLSWQGVMVLDLALILARPSAFEYVLVHELCHLLQHNHSPAFWREVEARCPDWRCERDYLRQHGHALKATLRAFLHA